MKKITSILAIALAVMSISACQKEQITEVSKSTNSISACISTTGETKTALANDEITWSKEDKVYVLYNKDGVYKTSQYVLRGDGGTKDGIFDLSTGDAVDANTMVSVFYTPTFRFNNEYAVPSIPAEQTYTSNGISTKTLPMFASGLAGSTLNFQSFGGILRFSVYGAKEDLLLKNVMLSCDNAIAGIWCYKLGTPCTYYGTGGVNKLIQYEVNQTLPTSEAEALEFNIVVGPCTLKNAKLTFNFKNGASVVSIPAVEGKNQTIKRNQILSFNKICLNPKTTLKQMSIDGGSWTDWPDVMPKPTASVAVKTEGTTINKNDIAFVLNGISGCAAGSITVDFSEAEYYLEKMGDDDLGFSKSAMGALYLPKVKKLDGNCVVHNSKLNDLWIPLDVNSIKGCFVRGMSSVGKIHVDSGNSKYYSDEHGNVYTKGDSKELVLYPNRGNANYTVDDLPEGLTSLTAQVFMAHSNLVCIYLPATVTYLGTQCFYYAPYLSDIYVGRAAPPTLANDFFVKDGYDAGNAVSGPKTIHVPSGSKTAYETNDQWKYFLELGWTFDDGTEP